MSTDQINYLNVGLIILSAVFALYMPFELFLLAYTILGPLHYLTEISWLQKRQYFSPGKFDYVFLAVVALLILLPVSFTYIYGFFGSKDAFHHLVVPLGIKHIYMHMVSVRVTMMFVGFASAVTMIITRETWKRIVSFLVIIALAIIFRKGGFISIFFAIFVPTLIHVFVFTAIFMFVGALRGRRFSGYLAIIILLLCSVALFIINPSLAIQPGTAVVDRYDYNFSYLNRAIFASILHKSTSANDIYYSTTGILITRFIAFAYAYHYLNWFSKTTVIKWHKVSARSGMIIAGIWLFSLALYFYNFKVGLVFLYFMGTLHVVLEFPLNFQSFREIGSHLGLVPKPKA